MEFPGAGKAIETQPPLVGYQQYASGLSNEDNEPSEWAPFSSHLKWEVARWAKLRGPSSTALSGLLHIDGVSRPAFSHSQLLSIISQLSELLGLSFSSSEELNKIINKKLPNGLPQFIREEVKVTGRHMSFTTVIYSNASKPSTVIQNLWSFWSTPPKNAILAPTKSTESSPR